MQESQDMRVGSLGQEGSLEEGMATHSSILAWRIPWMEEHCRLQSMGSQRVGHDWATFTFFDMFYIFYMLCLSVLALILEHCPFVPFESAIANWYYVQNL